MNFDQNLVYEDDIYIYGNMVINEINRWVLFLLMIGIEFFIISGRFVDIYKVMYRFKGNNEWKGIVVVKILKSKYNLDVLLLKLFM